MKIRIAFYKDSISWKKNWIFVGKSFRNLKIAEKKIIGPRIKINDFLHETFDSELKNYLEWTEKQRVFFKDSVNWWMTELAGRNNLSSDFFLYVCQIKSLKKIINNIKENELLIVSDDILLMKAIMSNLDKNELQIYRWLGIRILINLINHYYNLKAFLIFK